jgi:hypothetical protein
MKHTEVYYKKFGKCLKVSNGNISYIVTLDVGPRIISFSKENEDNILYEDINENLTKSGSYFDNTFGSGATWKLYGGHRFWVAPQTMASYYPDNNPLSYIVSNDSIEYIQTIQSHTRLQLKMIISFNNNNCIRILHTVTNHGSKTQFLSPWSITALKGGGLEVVPLSKEETNFAPQRYMSLWDFGSLYNDTRCYYGNRYFTLKHQKDSNPYKIGFNVSDGYAFYIYKNLLYVKRFNYDRNVNYADNNINFETYTDSHLLEMETLGRYQPLEIHQTVYHEEIWELYDFKDTIPTNTNEEMFDEIVNTIIEK